MGRLSAIFGLTPPTTAQLREKLFRECNHGQMHRAGDIHKIRKILAAGPDLDVSLLRGPTHRGENDIVELLVNAGTPFDGKDYLGLPPLMQAIKSGHEDLALYYFRKGADFMTVCSKNYGSALDAVREEAANGRFIQLAGEMQEKLNRMDKAVALPALTH